MKITGKVEAHQTDLKLLQQIPASVPVGSDIRVKAEVTCPSGCDLQGALVHLVDGGNVVATKSLVAASGTPARSETEEFPVKVPETVGPYSWLLVFPDQDIEGKIHQRASMTVSFATVPIGASVAVWEVPSPVTIGQTFKLKAGVKSAQACMLKDSVVEVLDETGEVKGAGTIGDSPWLGTSGLYWTEIEVTAPLQDGPACWTARFAGGEWILPHEPAQFEFTFAAVRQGDHKLTVTVVDKETGVPIENGHVRLGYHRAVTDASGVAELSIPAGNYELTTWMTAHETKPMPIEVKEDLMLRLEADPVPEEDPAAMWM
jgi:hypothetical protein